MITILDLYSGYGKKGGIFSFMQEPAWKAWDVDNYWVDRVYFHKHGLKRPSHAVTQYADFDVLDVKTRQFLSDMLYFEYKHKWKKLFDTLNFDYNPICNYDMKEKEDINGEHHNKSNGTSNSTDKIDTKNDSDYNLKRTGEDTTESTSTTENTTSRNTKDGVYGWNVNEVSERSDQRSTEDSNNTVTGTTTNKPNTQETQTAHNNTGTTDTITSGFDNEQTGDQESHRILTRAGNIGVMTTQNMINQERELLLWNYFDTIFKDVNKVLTIPIY